MSGPGRPTTSSPAHEEFAPKHGCNGCVRITSTEIKRTEFRITRFYPRHNGPARLVYNDIYGGSSSNLLATHKKTPTEDMAKFFQDRYVEVIINQESINGVSAGNRTVLDILRVPQWLKWKAIVPNVAITIVVPSTPISITDFKDSAEKTIITAILAELSTYTALCKVKVVLKIQNKELNTKEGWCTLAPYLFPLFDRECSLEGYHLCYQIGDGKAVNVPKKKFIELRNVFKGYCRAERGAAREALKREKELHIEDLDEFPSLGGSRQKTRNN